MYSRSLDSLLDKMLSKNIQALNQEVSSLLQDHASILQAISLQSNSVNSWLEKLQNSTFEMNRQRTLTLLRRELTEIKSKHRADVQKMEDLLSQITKWTD